MAATIATITKMVIPPKTPPQNLTSFTTGIGSEVWGVPPAANAGTFPPWPVGGISVSGLVGESPKGLKVLA